MTLTETQKQRKLAGGAELPPHLRPVTSKEAYAQYDRIKAVSNRSHEPAFPVNTGAGKQRKRSPNVITLASLEGEDRVVVKHVGQTPFSVWLAVQRERLDKPFQWCGTKEKGRYEVWLDGTKTKKMPPSASTQRPVPSCPYNLEMIDWDCQRFSKEDRRAIVGVLAAYQCAPRRGHGGGLMSRASRAAKVPYRLVRAWMKLALVKTAIEHDDPRFRSVLRAFVEATAESEEAWIICRIVCELKKGRAVEAKLSERFKGLLETYLSRYRWHRIQVIKAGRPALCRITADTDEPDRPRARSRRTPATRH